ncbi:hypothetical protein BSKO_11430 [Bryopsis sp. KO-2023]|nr:hypothetical protein BSKO_11430 [Bryopsis sp. KO-2023]
MRCPHTPLRLVGTLVVLLLARFSTVSGRRQEDDDDVIPGAIHTIISTECTPYFSFQTLALAYTHRAVGQPGPLTRILSCEPEDLAEFSPEDMSIVDTHVTPSFTHNPKNGDDYSPYNKPSGVMHWLDKVKPKEEWILIMDADTVFRRQILPGDLDEGWLAASQYMYMIGGRNALADRHIPEVPRRKDAYGGRIGRRGDEAGAYYMIRRKDLRALAPLWLKYTEDVRDDPAAWNLTGDAYVKEGEKAWISEMYGWVFGAAKLGLKHRLDPTVQVYPDTSVRDVPRIIHYGLEHRVAGFRFNKHEHKGFDFTRCPPWDLSVNRSQGGDAGLFPHPPYPSEVPKEANTTEERYGMLLNIEFMNTVNAALCERHRKKCPDSVELQEECGKVDGIAEALRLEYLAYDGNICKDEVTKECPGWKARGECEANWMALQILCRKTCGGCSPQDAPENAPHLNVTSFAVRTNAPKHKSTQMDREVKRSRDNGVAVHEEPGDGTTIAATEFEISNKNNNNLFSGKTEFALRVRCERIKSTKLAETLECSKLVLVAETPRHISGDVHNINMNWIWIEVVCLVVALVIFFIYVRRERFWRKHKSPRLHNV